MDNLLLISNGLLWLFVILNFLITISLVRSLNSISDQATTRPDSEILDIGIELPETTFKDITGEIVKLGDMYTNKAMLIFLSSGCPPCREKMPLLAKLYQKAHNEGMEILPVILDTLDVTRTFINEHNYQLPILVAPLSESNIRNKLKIPGTPSYYIIDRKGVIEDGGLLGAKWDQIEAHYS